MKFSNRFFAFIFVIFFSCSDRTSSRFSNEEYEEISEKINSGIRNTLKDESLAKFLNGREISSSVGREISEFYQQRKYKPAWITVDEPTPAAGALLMAIEKSPEDGLKKEDYNIETILELQEVVFSDSIAEEIEDKLVQLELLMTTEYLTLASHMLSGKIDPEKADTNWHAYPREKDLSEYLAKAIDKEKIEESIQELALDNDQYKKLKGALAFLREIESRGGWNPIPENVHVNQGDSAEIIKTIKQRLALTNDLDKEVLQSPMAAVYDKKLSQSIKHFQARHGIEEDGKVGPETITAMNIPVQQRISQIQLNMERLRWLPDEFSDHYLLVNIPEYKLRIYEKGEDIIEMRVIVGETMNETPIFSDTLEFIVFSPTWTVPLSIARKEFLPKLQENPEEFLEQGNYKIYESWAANAKQVEDVSDIDWEDMEEEEFNYRLVEEPGPENSLGQVKFIFPNSDAIYLHDTPANYLFDRTERNFSHGCIRVEDPMGLAEYLLNDKKWSKEKIKEFMEKEKPENVSLPEELPVHIVYHSAWVDEEGNINFRKDIYNHDKAQEKAIEKKEPAL